MRSLCRFAPVDHVADVTTLLFAVRGCGHQVPVIHACAEHAEQFPPGHETGRPTACPACGQVTPIRVVQHQPVRTP